MNVEPFDKEKDYSTLVSWMKKKNLLTPAAELFPEVGFIVPNIASGHLFQTDSAMAMIDYLYSNPESSKHERNEALDLVVSKICETARELGFSVLCGTTCHDFVIDRAKKHGFLALPMPYTFIAKILTLKEGAFHGSASSHAGRRDANSNPST